MPQLQCGSGKPHEKKETYIGTDTVCRNLNFVAKSFDNFPKVTGVMCQFSPDALGQTASSGARAMSQNISRCQNILSKHWMVNFFESKYS